MSYQRASLRNVQGYSPGKQPVSRQVIKLNTNENPYPPAAQVLQALAYVAAEELRRYPPPFADAFRVRAAALHGVGVDQVMATNGGDELLRLAVSTFVEPGQPLGVFEPSYSLYPVLAELHQSPLVRVELGQDWSRPADAAEHFNQEGVRLVCLVNPHAPSGRLTPVPELRALARALDGVLLVDEAYVDFVDPALGHEAVSLVNELDNVLILRTLSKGYSLAGLRFGYGLGASSLIEPMLTKTRDSYNVDAIAQRLALAALEAQDEAEKTWAAVRAEREGLAEALRARGFYVPDSQANFLLAQAPAGQEAAVLTAALEQQGVLVRYFGSDARLADKLRITVGAPEENTRLLRALDTSLGRST